MQTLKQLAIAGFIFACLFAGGWLLRDAQWQAKHDDYITGRDQADKDAADAAEAAQKLVDEQMANDMDESEKRHYEQLKETQGNLGAMRDQFRALNERLRQQAQATNHCEAVGTGAGAGMGVGSGAEYQDHYDTLQRGFDESSDDAITAIKQRDFWKDRANILEGKNQ